MVSPLGCDRPRRLTGCHANVKVEKLKKYDPHAVFYAPRERRMDAAAEDRNPAKLCHNFGDWWVAITPTQ
jgi:hypothetical protein